MDQHSSRASQLVTGHAARLTQSDRMSAEAMRGESSPS
jgi:hypothetical protein